MSTVFLQENIKKNGEDLFFDSVLNCINDGIVIADKNGQFLFWNKAAEEIVGIGNSDATPDKWSEYYGCFYSDGVTPYPSHEIPLVKAIKGQSTDNAEMLIRNHRTTSLIKVQGQPIKDKNGDVSAGIVILKSADKNQSLETLNKNKKQQYEREFKNLEGLKNASKLDTFSKLFDFKPLNKTEPDIFSDILSRYKSLIDLSTTIKDECWEEDITSELCILAKKLVFLKASPSDILDIHNLAIRKKFEDKREHEIDILIERGRRMSLELMSLIISYYRNNSIALNRSISLNEGKFKTL